jgi:hypothetical protein
MKKRIWQTSFEDLVIRFTCPAGPLQTGMYYFLETVFSIKRQYVLFMNFALKFCKQKGLQQKLLLLQPFA